MAVQKINNLVWIDLEMTGLDVRKDKILQIGVVITDNNLKALDRGKVYCIKIDKNDIELMDDVVKDMHTQNNLIYKCLKSRITLEKAEERVVKYISKYVNPHESPLCGTTNVFDRIFIDYYMPKLKAHLHYRNIDVSSIRQLSKIWLGVEEHLTTRKPKKHDALDDIKSTILKARFYKKNIFDKVN